MLSALCFTCKHNNNEIITDFTPDTFFINVWWESMSKNSFKKKRLNVLLANVNGEITIKHDDDVQVTASATFI